MASSIRVPAAGLAIVLLLLFHLPAAAQQDDEALAWDSIKTSQSANDFDAFLQAFPKGNFANAARQKYSLLSDALLPPKLQKLDLRYPSDWRRLWGAMGPKRIVKLDVLVQKDGKAGDIKITRRSGYDPLDSAAVSAARKAIYLPAVDHGMAVSARMPLEILFGLFCAAGEALCGEFPRKKDTDLLRNFSR